MLTPPNKMIMPTRPNLAYDVDNDFALPIAPPSLDNTQSGCSFAAARTLTALVMLSLPYTYRKKGDENEEHLGRQRFR